MLDTIARDVLDGGAHACLPWLPETLEAIGTEMQGEAFWCRRKGDAFIRGFGGPYVLGQDEGKLKVSSHGGGGPREEGPRRRTHLLVQLCPLRAQASRLLPSRSRFLLCPHLPSSPLHFPPLFLSLPPQLIRGAAHTALTTLVGTAHSLIYTAVHLQHPPAPGFNTLIFGLNLRSRCVGVRVA